MTKSNNNEIYLSKIYRPQQISVPSYAVEQPAQPVTTAKTTTTTQNRNGTQYDPTFYNVYDDDSEIYKDVGKLTSLRQY